MNCLKIFRTSLVLCAIPFMLGATAYAQDSRFLSVYHTEYGLKLFAEHKMDLALERFVKAYLLDPHNTTAKESLLQIASEQKGQGSKGLKILRFIDQIEYLNFLSIRYENLTQENSRLLELLQNNQGLQSNIDLLKDFTMIKIRVQSHPSAYPRISLIGFATDDSKTYDIDALTTQLANERQNFTAEINFLENTNSHLRDLRKELIMSSSGDSMAAISNKYKSHLDELNQRMQEKDQLLSLQQQNIEYFKKELGQVREDFITLQKKFKETDVKITQLTSRIAGLSVELFEKNKIIDQKDERAALLEKDISNANEKMNLVQKIIEEKNDRIGILEKEMIVLQTALSSEGKPTNKHIARLQNKMDDFETQFKEQLDKSRDRIINLEIRYTEISGKYQDLAQELQSKTAQVANLKKTLSQKEILAQQYKEAFITTDQKANQLIGMVEIYRGKLAELQKNRAQQDVPEDNLPRINITPVAPVNAPPSSREQTSFPAFRSAEKDAALDLSFSPSLINQGPLPSR